MQQESSQKTGHDNKFQFLLSRNKRGATLDRYRIHVLTDVPEYQY